MASRAIWKGQLRLSLVSIPVEVHSATKSNAKPSFRQIHGPTGKPVHYEKTVAGVGPVKADDILKGYETADGDYVLIDPEEIEAIRLETRKTLELVQFVDLSEIAPLWFDRPYYIVPTDALAEDAYRVVRDALRAAGRVGLGQMVMRGKEYLCAVKPCGDGLLMETLHYADELRQADPLFSGIGDEAVDDDLLDVARTLIDRKTAKFDPRSFTDRYAVALRDLVEAKVKNRKTPRARVGSADEAPVGGRGNVIDLMEALKRSLSETKGAAAPKGKAKAAAKEEAPPAPAAKPARKAAAAKDETPAPKRNKAG